MIFQFQEENQILLTSLLTLMMPTEVVQNQIQFFVGGHMGFGRTTTMSKIQSNVHFDVTLDKLKIVHFIIGDLDIVIWEISTLSHTNQLMAMMKTQSITYVKILVWSYTFGFCILQTSSSLFFRFQILQPGLITIMETQMIQPVKIMVTDN